jgi:hypothetical protein
MIITFFKIINGVQCVISVFKEYQIVPEITAETDSSKQHIFMLVCAAVTLTAVVSLLCTKRNSIMCLSIANGCCVTGMYRTKRNYVPQYR